MASRKVKKGRVAVAKASWVRPSRAKPRPAVVAAPRHQHGHRVTGVPFCALHKSCAAADAHALEQFSLGESLTAGATHCSLQDCYYCAAIGLTSLKARRR